MRKPPSLTKRITAMLLSGMLVFGSVPGAVFAADVQENPDQTSEVAEEVLTEDTSEAPTSAGETSEESFSEEASADEAAIEYYTVTLDANGGYFENEWDDAIDDYVQQTEVIKKQIPVGESLTAVPVYETELDGHTMLFAGWSLESNGEPVSQVIEEYVPLDNCVLYALWQTAQEAADENAEQKDTWTVEEAEESEDSETVKETEDAQESVNTDGGEETEIEFLDSEEAEAAQEFGETADEADTAQETVEGSDVESDEYNAPEIDNEQDTVPAPEGFYSDDEQVTSESSSDSNVTEEETNPDIIESSEEEEAVKEDAANSIVKNGTCGENLTWTLDDAGTLTISGTGEMTELINVNSYDVKKAIIKEGMTSIMDAAFKDSVLLESVTIPNSVISIGFKAFDGCSNLTSLTIPDSVTSIGAEAFALCSGLQSLTIPDSVTSIGYSAFYQCRNLTSVTIPNSVTSIESNLFYECTNLTSVTIPDGVEQIGKGAFCRCSLTSVTIPDSVTSIGDSAFQNCCFTSVTIPDSVTSIGDKAFHYCYALTSVTIPNSLTDIGKEVFSCCSNLTNVTLQKGLTYIGESMFEDCRSLTSVTIPESVYCIVRKAFSGCENLTSVTIPGNANIGDRAFETYPGVLTSLTVCGSVTSSGLSTFRTCRSLNSVIIQDGVTSIGDSAFSSFDNLTSVTIPNSVISIGDSAFSGCTNLPDLTIPDSVTSIGSSAFSDCTNLANMTIPVGVTNIGNYTFSGCTSLTKVTIPASVTNIGSNAYSGCTSLTSVTIPASVTSIGANAFSGCTSLTKVTIPTSVTSIGSSAFSDCINLTNITIPVRVTSIKDYVFSGCTGLTNVAIPANVTSIGNNAFSDCTSLTSVAIPVGVTSIGSSAFSGCTSLTSVTIPVGVTKLGSSVFSGCTSLTSVTIPASVTSMWSNMFESCSSLKDIYYGAGKEDWEKIFKGSLSGVTIHYNSTGPTEPIDTPETLNEILPAFELSTDTISFQNNSIGDKLLLNLKAKNVPLDEQSGSLTQEQKDALCFHVTGIDFEINGTPVAYFTKTGNTYTQKKSIVPLDGELDIPIDEEKQLADFEILTNPPVIIDSPTQVAEISFTVKGTINGNPVEVQDEKTVTFLYDFFDETEYIDLTDDYNDGMLNSLAYLMDNGNFPAAAFAMIDENDTGSQIVKDVTDLLYRGWDGRKELIWGELSTEDAQQILIDLINDIDVDIKGFAKIKTAKEFADLLTEGFEEWSLLKGNDLVDDIAIKDIINSVNLDVTNEYIQKLLIDGKFDTMATLVWDDDKYGPQLSKLFIKYCNSLQSAEKISKVLKGFGTGIKILSLGMDTIQNYYDLKSLAATDEMYSVMLLYLRDNCSYKPVSTAAGNLYEIVNDATKQVGYLLKDINEEANEYVIGVGVKACTVYISTTIEAAKKKLLFLQAAKYGYKVGVFLSNTILHTSDSQALKDRLHSLSHIGSSLSKWVADAQNVYFASSGSEKNENIRKVAYGQYMLLKTRMLGEKTYQRLLEMYHKNSTESHRVSVFISSVLDGQAEYLAENGIFLKMKGIGVYCPVDVQLIDENNNTLITVSDGLETSGRIGDIFYWVYYNSDVDDYSKVILYPRDRNYSIKIQGNETGNVTALYTEFDDEGAAKCLSMTEVKVDDQTVISLDNISASSDSYTVINNENTYTGELESTIQRELTSYSTSTENCKHDFGDWSILRQATTNSDGKKVQYCKKCGYENIEDIEKTEEVASGTCSDGLVWILDSGGTLRISGNGEMNDYSPSDSPWNEYKSDIKTVLIKKGVTNIGKNAFYQCDNLTIVTIPESVTTIEFCAFSQCNSLTIVTIPESVTTVGSYAFSNCSNLTRITIPKSVTTIGNNAFSSCNSLTSLSFSEGLTYIGTKAFSSCTGLTKVLFPSSLTHIGSDAFSLCTGLTNVTIPASVTSISGFVGRNPFPNCTSLTNISVESGNTKFTSIDGVLFNRDSTQLICYPAGKEGAYSIPESVTSLGTFCFSGCNKLTYVTISENVTSIGKSAFVNCNNLSYLKIPSFVTSITESAFNSCTSLTSVVIPSSVTSIENQAFKDCHDLSVVYFTGTQEEWEAIEIGTNNGDLTNAEIVYVDNINSLKYAEISGLSASEYTGKAIKPEPVVRLLGTVLKPGKDYTVSYSNNIGTGTATVTVTGLGSYVDSATAEFTITPASLSCASITGLETKTYIGRAITQNPVVKLNSTTLTKDTDYTVSYKDNTFAGTATVTITGKGNYTESKSEAFEINKAMQSITAKSSVSSVSVGKTATVSISGAKGTKSYKSSNTAIATVNASTGVVTAKKVGSVKITATAASTDNFNAVSKTVAIQVVPAATASLTAANQVKGVKLTWKKVAGANGYIIYRGSKKIKTITSGSTVTFTDTGANTNGGKYVFKIIAKASTGTSTLSKSAALFRVAQPAIKTLKSSSSGKMTVTWGKNAKGSGYQIQYSSKSDFKTQKTVTVGSAKTVSKTISGLTKKHKYYVRIRAYKTGTSGKTKYYSAWSAKKTVKTK